MITPNTRNIISKLQACLPAQPVNKAWLFGSYSRGEEHPDSDVDILVKYIDSDHMSLMDIARVMNSLRKAIGRDVDLIEDGCLMPFAAESANQDKILIYERKYQG